MYKSWCLLVKFAITTSFETLRWEMHSFYYWDSSTRYKQHLYSYSNRYCWMQFVCNLSSITIILWISLSFPCIVKLQLLYFIGLRKMSVWSTEHWATEKKSLFLFFTLIMKKYFRKLLSTCNVLVCLFFLLLMNEMPMNYHPEFLSEYRFLLRLLVLGKNMHFWNMLSVLVCDIPE